MKSSYDDELEFERDLIELLSTKKGWKAGVLRYKTERDLIRNWADILYNNNRTVDRLGDYPLTDTEMGQILSKINTLRSPLKLNDFINGKVITIKRDNEQDKLHFGKDVSLKIYDRDEIAAGQSVYQIAEQPIFSRKSEFLPNRRGDFMLLINGMPLIHVELKKSLVPISQAQNQIIKYSQEGLFTGLFSLIQVFVAMTPEEMTYFANPGPDGKFNKKFFFHWEDFNNEIIGDWRKIADQFLSIPMAHQLIGFYTVADDTDGTLKIMRSYQYYAANAISDAVSKVNKAGWDDKRTMRGGYIWHTTGSGKTMTSFKSAQLIANSMDADKVVFLVDRIELGTQSLQEYRGFAGTYEEVYKTDSADDLRSKLVSGPASREVLIVTSIQKMSLLKADDPAIASDIEKIRKKRLVIIIDECHRSVFGDMLQSIQDTFPNALMFGFTGTPIQEENEKNGNTTSSIFGDELHRYSIGDGIRDGNVLGFDPYRVETFSERDVRLAVALEKAKAHSVQEVLEDKSKSKVFYHYMDDLPMASNDGHDIESCIPVSQYQTPKHQEAVCKSILQDWVYVSRNRKYSAIFATSSIPEACQYYRLLKKMISESNGNYPELRIVGLFDPTTDNDENAFKKEQAIVEMLSDYQKMFGLMYSLSHYDSYKKDVANRLAHKKPYQLANVSNGDTIDLLIVVNQMLTGYDSRWINALYLDKKLEYESIVQAFSRTNRINGDDKPAGVIKYYRYPNTMKLNISKAFEIYSGNKPFGIFVDKLEDNLNSINSTFAEIKKLFENARICNFERNPDDKADVSKFVLLFNALCKKIESAKVQGFRWSKIYYEFEREDGSKSSVELQLDQNLFETLKQRYRELVAGTEKETTDTPSFDLDPTLVSTEEQSINFDYMESKFKKYLKEIQLNGPDCEAAIKLLDEVRQSFAFLSQSDQKLANIIIHDIQSGDRQIKDGESLTDLINEYRTSKRDKAIHKFCEEWFIPEVDFRKFAEEYTNLETINEYGRLDNLLNKINKKSVYEKIKRELDPSISLFKTSIYLTKIIRAFVVSGCIGEED